MKPLGSFKFLNNSIKIQISHKDLSAIKHLVAIAPQEAQWFHRLEVIDKPGETTYRIYDMFIPEQVCSATQVESSDSMMIDFYRELLKDHGPEETNAIMQSMNVWCHSHHNMSPSPSGQDHKQFMEFIKYNIDAGSRVPQIMLIFNKKDQFYSRIFDPATGYICENVSIEVETEDFTWIDEAAKQKFKKPAPRKLPQSFKGMPQQSFGFQNKGSSKKKTPSKGQEKSSPILARGVDSGNSELDAYYKRFLNLHTQEFDIITETMREVFSNNSTHGKDKLYKILEEVSRHILDQDDDKFAALTNFLINQTDDEDLRQWEEAWLEYDDEEKSDASAKFIDEIDTGSIDDATLSATLFFVSTLYPNPNGLHVVDAESREELIDWWLSEVNCLSWSPVGDRFGGSSYEDYFSNWEMT